DYVGIGRACSQRTGSMAGSLGGTGSGSITAGARGGDGHAGAEMGAEVFGNLGEFGLTGLGAATDHGVDDCGPLVARAALAHDHVGTVAGGTRSFRGGG